MTPSPAVRVVVEDQHFALSGDLTVPDDPAGVVVFAKRMSPRTRVIADAFNRAGFATLLVDLRSHEAGVDVAWLAERLTGTLAWVAHHDRLAMLQLGLFGAEAGAAAALVTASRVREVVTIVSLGGYLGGVALEAVHVPTLLVVGGADPEVLAVNRLARARLPATTVLYVVPGATHQFDVPGELDEVVTIATGWFRDHLAFPTWRQRHPIV
jgi:putative phosphoribosyl transferase